MIELFNQHIFHEMNLLEYLTLKSLYIIINEAVPYGPNFEFSDQNNINIRKTEIDITKQLSQTVPILNF